MNSFQLIIPLLLLLQLACSAFANNNMAKPLKASADPKAKPKGNKLVKDLYNAQSFADLSKLGVKINDKASFTIRPRSGGIDSGLQLPAALAVRDDTKQATPGKCDPKPVCISNPLTLNITASNQMVFPPCINIHRCDGCCPPNEECVATESSEVKLSKVFIIFHDGDKVTDSEERFITVSNHTDCQCQCKWKTDEDCKTVNANYIKDPNECQCKCPEEMMCGSYHEFDKTSCACVCKRSVFSKIEQTCRSRGYSWNDTACKCEAQSRPK